MVNLGNDKSQQFRTIEENILKDELFLTESTDMLQEEIQENLWSFSLTENLAKQITASDFSELLDKIKENAQKQLDRHDGPLELIYYLWHDQQSGQLRLNFINSNHHNLPFGCALTIVESETEIIHDFLNSKYLEGVSFSELEDLTEQDEEPEVSFVLKVYKRFLKKSISR